MKYTLSDLFDLQMGKTPSRSNPEYWSSKDNKWISIADLTKSGMYINHTKEYISNKAVEESKIKIIPENTVVMSFKLTIGKTAITSEPIYSNEAIMSFIDKGVIKIAPKYFYYLLSHFNWDTNSNKAVMGKTLNKATLNDIEVDVPNFEEQNKIARILDRVSKTIEIRNRQIQILDNLIEARFIELFGDKYLNDKEWNQDTLGNNASFCNGKAHEKVVDRNGKYILVTSKAIASNLADVRKTNTALSPLKKNDIVMVMSDVPNGRALAKCLLIEEDDRYTLNQRICSFNDYPFNPVFFYHLLNRHPYFLSFNDGNGQTNLRKNDILECPIIMPPMDLQTAFANDALQIIKLKTTIQNLIKETQLLFDNLAQGYFK